MKYVLAVISAMLFDMIGIGLMRYSGANTWSLNFLNGSYAEAISTIILWEVFVRPIYSKIQR